MRDCCHLEIKKFVPMSVGFPCYSIQLKPNPFTVVLGGGSEREGGERDLDEGKEGRDS